MQRATTLLMFSAFVLAGLFIYSQLNSPSSNSLSEEMPETIFVADTDSSTIEYTDGGYIPGTLNIKKGETVTFINKSKRSMWVASDNHPTHTIYSEFDQKGLSRAGETYSFTFENIGEWQYHDHLNPRADGTIIVE